MSVRASWDVADSRNDRGDGGRQTPAGKKGGFVDRMKGLGGGGFDDMKVIHASSYDESIP